MNEVYKALIFGIITFIIVFCVYYFLVLKRRYDLYNGKKKVKKGKKNKQTKPLDFMEFTYLVSRFNLDKDKVKVLYCFRWIAILDAFIIALTATIVYYVPGKFIWKFLVGFVMLFALIYALYEIFGRHLVKKGWSKNGIK